MVFKLSDFFKGVAWDPKNHYLATISTDRVCRIFDKNGKHVKSRIQRGKITSGSCTEPNCCP